MTNDRPSTAGQPGAVERPSARHRVTNRPPANQAPARHPASNRTGNRLVQPSRPPGRQNTGHHGPAAHHHRPVAHRHQPVGYRPLCTSQVRQQRFRRSRHGLDPAEVDGFLHRIADELTVLHAELARTREENARIKGALRDWQSRFAPRVVRV
ncbi:DivIVA domain-containing protein [Micromonospora sp. MMS20-R1-14]|uniref:DivIVA domain-containing protein n=1 Tax=Micromonospora humida TaxID=2809018 RepID=A0ABS2IT64_9ACTN|nr:DivIVA domain-containing protein [Micromonospora humida]